MGKRIKDLSRAETDGYLAVDNALNGTGKMNTSVIFNNFAEKFVPNETSAIADELYTYEGVLYKAKVNYSGDWDATKFEQISSSQAFGSKRLESDVETGKFLLADVSVANNSRLNKKIKLTTKYIWLVVESSFMTSYRVYYADSTGTLPDRSSDTTTYTIGIPQLVSLPRGYDTIWLFGYGQDNTTGSTQVVKISKYIEPLELISQKHSVDLSGIEIVDIYKMPSSSRLNRYIKYDSSSVKFRLDLGGAGSYPYQYRVYFVDSTGVNPNNTSNAKLYDFGKYYSIDIPAGYDTIWYFCGTYNTSGSEVDVIIGNWFDGTINRRVTLLEESIDAFLPFKGKNIVCFGDSITQFTYNGMSYPDYLRNLSGAVVTNAGIGGTRYSARGPQTTTPSTEGSSYRALDICNLVHSWCNNDWSYVDPAVEWLKNNNVTNLTSKITALKAVSVADVDVVTIMAGTNDFTGEVALGTSGTTDTSKVFGGVNSIIQDILSANPNIKIFMFSPTVRWFNYSGVSTSDPNDFSDVAVKGGFTLKEFSAAIVGEIEKSHIPVCDMYNTLGWNKWNFGNYFLDTDGTHPYKGFENIANRFYAFLTAFNN